MTIDPDRLVQRAVGVLLVALAAGIVFAAPSVLVNPISSRILAGFFVGLVALSFFFGGLALALFPEHVVGEDPGPSGPTDVPRPFYRPGGEP